MKFGFFELPDMLVATVTKLFPAFGDIAPLIAELLPSDESEFFVCPWFGDSYCHDDASAITS